MMNLKLCALLGAIASVRAAPQGVTENISPPSGAPDGCQRSFDGRFAIGVETVGSGSGPLGQIQCNPESQLVLTLNGGVLLDNQERTGYIASNFQFQFDGPPQAGAIYTAGFSVCSNGTLALGGSTVFYRCLSGDFYNLYDRHWAAQCEAVQFFVATCAGENDGSGPAPTTQVVESPDGQVVPTSVVGQIPDGQPVVSQISDGQIQAPTGQPVVSQISDGQVQAPTGQPVVSQISDGQIQAPTGQPVVSQISDGQIQAPTDQPVVSQISDGQVQAPTGQPVVSQISDGQIQAPTDQPVVSQISDGQVQAPTDQPVVTQISDGQVQAPTDQPVVSQISDGQIQAPTDQPVVSQISDGQVQAPTGTGSEVPPPTPTGVGAGASTPAVPPSSGTRVIVGTQAALFVAFIAAVLYM